MTVVIADSSPLNYLALIGSLDILHRLYGVVVVPKQVISELLDRAAPHDVRKWASNLPDWIDVREAVISDDDMTHLDPGVRQLQRRRRTGGRQSSSPARVVARWAPRVPHASAAHRGAA